MPCALSALAAAGDDRNLIHAAAASGSRAPGRTAPAITTLRVTLHESHVAWAAFEGGISAR